MAKVVCPLTGDECMQHGCAWYIHMLGKHPQTGADVNQFDCAVKWLPVLLIENAQQTRQMGAAVESFRNEVVKGNETAMQLQLGMAQQRLAQLMERPHAPGTDTVLLGDH